ncbi:hypothetical protein G5B00_15510 [Parapedobacter sp. SGR-10]|uniref:DUF6157 family protein n=1 Tax=Parapedobacter sp. SGR-10 TaxID=2710879 RepID=UPI0013D79990|nr:DUF6157 family protein [Parapedobacter sp. SGR-10]NGF57926.1 hypothetical protein [Parapedobacter sp. SGR-10]
MKQHTTNYYNTLITVAEDCKMDQGTVPPVRPEKLTVANYQYDLIQQNPLTYTSDDILFEVYAIRNDILEQDYGQERLQFYAKGQPCLRTSPLAKTYGWGIYHDKEGRVRLIDSGSEEYEKLIKDNGIKKVSAMKSKR